MNEPKRFRWFWQSNENQKIETDSLVDINECAETNKLIAGLALEALKPSIVMVMEQAGSLSRWLLATLVTINGGAILALLSIVDRIIQANVLVGFIFFVLGIVFAVLAATLAITTNAKPLATLGQMIGYWSMVSRDGERIAEIEKKLKINEKSTVRHNRRNLLVGSVSLAFFVFGIVIVMMGFTAKAA